MHLIVSSILKGKAGFETLVFTHDGHQVGDLNLFLSEGADSFWCSWMVICYSTDAPFECSAKPIRKRWEPQPKAFDSALFEATVVFNCREMAESKVRLKLYRMCIAQFVLSVEKLFYLSIW